MSRRTTGAAVSFLGAALVGVAGGWWLARSHDAAHRHELFASSTWRRFAALGWLERHGDAAALPLLRDYLAWEQQPPLRNRAKKVLATLESAAA